MVCPGYDAVFQHQLNPDDPFGGRNCTCYCAAMAVDDHTCGTKRPTGKHIRELTGDKSGGTTLAQVDYVTRVFYNVDLDTRYRYPWSDFVRRINAGQSAILQGGYGPIANSKFDAGRGFGGNHAIHIPSDWKAEDPLADGRAPGVYQYHGEVYPQDLLRRFAAHLNLEGRDGYPQRLLGDGLVYAAFTRDNEPDYKAVVHPLDGHTYRSFGVYTVSNGVITGSKVARTQGFSATCTAPRLYRWAGHTSQSLVQLTSGARAGQYIRSSYAKEL